MEWINIIPFLSSMVGSCGLCFGFCKRKHNYFDTVPLFECLTQLILTCISRLTLCRFNWFILALYCLRITCNLEQMYRNTMEVDEKWLMHVNWIIVFYISYRKNWSLLWIFYSELSDHVWKKYIIKKIIIGNHFFSFC